MLPRARAGRLGRRQRRRPPALGSALPERVFVPSTNIHLTLSSLHTRWPRPSGISTLVRPLRMTPTLVADLST